MLSLGLQFEIAEVSVWVKSTNPDLSQRLNDLTKTDKSFQESIPTPTSQDSSDTAQEEKPYPSKPCVHAYVCMLCCYFGKF